MKRRGYAYFVENPRILEDLIVPHPVEMERQFLVVKTVKLSKIDYENFITDMIADRQFIEENGGALFEGDRVELHFCSATRPRRRSACSANRPELCRMGCISSKRALTNVNIFERFTPKSS